MFSVIVSVIIAAVKATVLAFKEPRMVSVAVVVLQAAMLSNMFPSCVNSYCICNLFLKPLCKLLKSL